MRRAALRHLPALAKASPLTIIYVGLFAPPEPDLVLGYFGLTGRVVWADASTGDPSDARTADWITTQNASLGRTSSSLRPGYYLFLAGTARAYQSGLIDFDRDHLSLGVGVAAALLAIAFDNQTLARGAVAAGQAEAAMRVIDAFSDVLAGHEQAAHAPPPPPAAALPIDELAVAFEVLGVSASATQAAVKARYRALAKDWHPDRFGGVREKDATVRMTQVNIAYSVICNARGW